MKMSQHMTNKEIAHLLRQVAAAFEIKNADRFRLRAYENAADSIEHETTEIRDIWEEKKLQTIPGIGPTIAGHLDELFKTGKVTHFLQETKSLPQAMFDILGIPGIGAKTAYKLARELKLPPGKQAVVALKKAAEAGKIKQLEGFAAQSEQDIIAGIQEQEKRGIRILLAIAEPVSQKILEYMRQAPVKVIEPLGSLRRMSPTVGDIDLATATTKPQEVLEHFVKYPDKKTILAKGGNTARIVLKNNIQVDLKTQTPDKFGALLQHFTGSKNHNVHLRELAVKKDLSLSEYGIKRTFKGVTFKGKGDTLSKFATEGSFYKALGMAWIPPEMREDTGEIERALRNKLPNLVKLEDIKGDLHTHSDYDWVSSHDYGKDNFNTIIDTARKLGYDYIGLGDHNPSRSLYGEKKLIDLLKKRKEIIEKLKYSNEKNNTTRTINILNVIEVDILSDGSLALSDKALEELDLAIVSVHSAMRLPRKAMTDRVLNGLSHPKAKILGHPTGRLLNEREGYDLDWERIFTFCTHHHKYLEINCQPKRLDLSDVLVRRAKDAGVMLIVGTDSHAASQLDLMRFGVSVARRGWAEKQNVLNTLPWKEFRDIISSTHSHYERSE